MVLAGIISIFLLVFMISHVMNRRFEVSDILMAFMLILNVIFIKYMITTLAVASIAAIPAGASIGAWAVTSSEIVRGSENSRELGDFVFGMLQGASTGAMLGYGIVTSIAVISSLKLEH